MNCISPEKEHDIKSLLLGGNTVRMVSELVRCSKQTVVRVRRGIVEPMRCGCGKQAGHSGWCKIMMARSPWRQQAIDKQRANYRSIPKPAPDPDGWCRCGCGQKTHRAIHDEPSTGRKAGDFHAFKAGHYFNYVRQHRTEWNAVPKKERPDIDPEQKMLQEIFSEHRKFQAWRDRQIRIQDRTFRHAMLQAGWVAPKRKYSCPTDETSFFQIMAAQGALTSFKK